jgi:hypothetical protein
LVCRRLILRTGKPNLPSRCALSSVPCWEFNISRPSLNNSSRKAYCSASIAGLRRSFAPERRLLIWLSCLLWVLLGICPASKGLGELLPTELLYGFQLVLHAEFVAAADSMPLDHFLADLQSVGDGRAPNQLNTILVPLTLFLRDCQRTSFMLASSWFPQDAAKLALVLSYSGPFTVRKLSLRMFCL